MRVEQPEGRRGSLKWIQRAIARKSPELEQPILSATGARSIDWRSPLREDGHAEYRDAAFLDRLGLEALAPELARFWPARGPQWDALGLTSAGEVLLVEAKAHVGEMCSPASQASGASRAWIASRLEDAAAALGARAGHAPCIEQFYQLANRLAHLRFLRDHGVAARLVLVNFIGDDEMSGPRSAAEWQAAYQFAWHIMGLGRRHALAAHIIECFPDVRGLA